MSRASVTNNEFSIAVRVGVPHACVIETRENIRKVHTIQAFQSPAFPCSKSIGRLRGESWGSCMIYGECLLSIGSVGSVYITTHRSIPRCSFGVKADES